MQNILLENWIFPSLKELVLTKKGKKPKFLSPKEFVDSVPYLDVKALEKGEIRQFADLKSSNLLDKNDLVLLWDGARSGWVAKGMSGAIGSTLVGLKPVITNADYIYYFLKSKFDYLNRNTRGTGIPHVDPEVLWNIKFPLPPLAEQNRIVEKLNLLFGNLDKVRERLDNIPKMLKNFRQIILSQAVTGKLTEKWRLEKNLEEWTVLSSEDIFVYVTSGSRGWAKYYDNINGNQLFVRITNMSYESLSLNLSKEKLQLLNLPKSLNEGKRTLLRKGDILISITADIGMISLISEELPYESYINQHICLARPKSTFNSHYLSIFLKSNSGLGQLRALNKGFTKAGLSLHDVKSLKISLPSFKEQQEIVSRVESLFVKTDAIESQYKKIKQKIDNLPQTILAKAFRGELVPQDLNDEPAAELLKRIKEIKSLTNKVGKLKQQNEIPFDVMAN